eukprot:3751472-Amphidinium_carterae.1
MHNERTINQSEQQTCGDGRQWFKVLLLASHRRFVFLDKLLGPNRALLKTAMDQVLSKIRSYKEGFTAPIQVP